MLNPFCRFSGKPHTFTDSFVVVIIQGHQQTHVFTGVMFHIDKIQLNDISLDLNIFHNQHMFIDTDGPLINRQCFFIKYLSTQRTDLFKHTLLQRSEVRIRELFHPDQTVAEIFRIFEIPSGFPVNQKIFKNNVFPGKQRKPGCHCLNKCHALSFRKARAHKEIRAPVIIGNLISRPGSGKDHIPASKLCGIFLHSLEVRPVADHKQPDFTSFFVCSVEAVNYNIQCFFFRDPAKIDRQPFLSSDTETVTDLCGTL